MKKIAEKIFLIGSGKGGVGKSTISVNLAIELGKMGHRVGLLDADLYGPSLPIMMGLRNLSPRMSQNGLVIPFTKFSIHTISLGFFLEEARSIIWRGPMLHQMLEKMLYHVLWPELDCLIVDLPPGTGDVLISLAKLLKSARGIIVTTPQEVAILDALKAIHAFDQLDISLMGIIENMASFQPHQDQPVYFPFGQNKGKELAFRINVPLLASFSLHSSISEGGDVGIPYATHSSFFLDLAHKVSSELK